MTHEHEGLPGLYRKARERKAIKAAPDGVRRNRKEINELKKRVVKLEKKIK